MSLRNFLDIMNYRISYRNKYEPVSLDMTPTYVTYLYAYPYPRESSR